MQDLKCLSVQINLTILKVFLVVSNKSLNLLKLNNCYDREKENIYDRINNLGKLLFHLATTIKKQCPVQFTTKLKKSDWK